MPRPRSSRVSAFPMMAPVVRPRSTARLACPGTDDVVSRSPHRMGVSVASAICPDLPHQRDRHPFLRPVEHDRRPDAGGPADGAGDAPVIVGAARTQLPVVLQDDHGAGNDLHVGDGERLGVVRAGTEDVAFRVRMPETVRSPFTAVRP